MIVVLIMFLSQLLIATMLFLHDFPKRKHFWPRLAGSCAVAYLLCTLNSILIRAFPFYNAVVEIYQYLFVYLNIVGIVWFSYRLEPIEALFFSSSGYAVQNIAHYLYVILLALPWLKDVGFRDIACTVLAFAAVYGITALLTCGHKKRAAAPIKTRSIIVVSVAALFVSVVLSEMVPIVPQEQMIDYMFCYLYSLLSPLLVLFLQYGLYEKYLLLHENEIMRQMLYMESRQHKLSEDTIALINIKCHDLKNQISTFSQAGKVAPEVAEEIQHTINVYDAEIETGNAALDVVLTEKNFRCERGQIAFSCMLDGTLFDFMTAADIYSLFGNALDNAIESVIQEPEENRFISLKAGQQGNLICIHAENYCGKELCFENGLPVTTKTDAPGYHGYGVKSIRFLAEKYGGYAQMRLEDRQFILDIFLPVAV